MKPSLTQLGIALCALLYGASGSAHASPGVGAAAAAPQLFATQNTVDVQMVGDDVLARQTGKYAGASMISGFVLNVLSQWHLPNGMSAEAHGSLSAMRDERGRMSTSVSTHASVTGDGPGRHSGGHQGNYADNAANAAANWGADPNAHVSGAQSVAVNGVSQVTQVAGNSNSGTNSALIDFSNNVAPVVSANNAASASASDPSGAVKAGISFGSNGVKVALQTPAGLATQTIEPGNGQIAQLLQIAGNNQQVANALQLHLQTQQVPTAMLRQLGVLQALQNRR